MIARVLSLLAVLLVVSACSSTPKDDGLMTSDSGAMGATTTQTQPVDPSAMGGAVPGSQQDLVMNVGDRIFFGYDQYDLTTEARTTVERQAQWLKTYPNVNLTVEGHCDERGTREYNLALGEKRAMAVRNYLIANGVSPARVQTISYGKERPAIMGSDESSWAQNRRGVLVVQ